jgi:GNAT superfamily N-acetyltransferase
MLKILTGEIKLFKLDLPRDFEDIDRLMELEEWPFSRNDLELSHNQPKSTSFVARNKDRVVGFFTTHNFGDVGYLDMMIVEKEYRKSGVAKALYLKTILELKRKGIKKYVVHTTNDSSPMIRFLRFKPGMSFTLLAREGSTLSGRRNSDVQRLGSDDFADVLELDSLSFGLERQEWIRTLLGQEDVVVYGLCEGSTVKAALCLRPRKAGAFCLEAIHGPTADLSTLTEHALFYHGKSRLESFAKTESEFHHILLRHGFEVPGFFKDIGPLVEWHRGDTQNLGAEKLSLSWL